MFEDKTRNIIHQEMLDEIPSIYDKIDGSFIYDSTKPAAIELEKAYQDLDSVADKLSIDNLTGDELAQRVRERTGIVRNPATKAIGVLNVTGTGTITTGDLFQTAAGIQFEANETKAITTNGTVNIQAVLAGSSGNIPANQINFIPVSISGIVSVTNLTAAYDGFEAKSDAALLVRYYERIQTPATSGNKAHYKNWAKEVPGIGDAKVFSLWNGDNTVKVTIINADKEPASAGLVATVQEYIDPNSEGLGEGQAPIGAYCTVVSATAKIVNVQLTVTLEPGYTVEMVQDTVEASLTNYLRSIAFQAEIVSYALIGANIINSEGVLDYSGLLVNGATANILLGAEETPVLGTVTINE